MKILSRDFTPGEKALLLVLALVLLCLGYFRLIYEPTKSALLDARSESAMLQTELAAVNRRVAALDAMQNDLDSLTEAGTLRPMGSYNNARAELDLLNDVFRQSESYSVTVSGISRSGDLVRRSFQLTFDAPDFETVRATLSALAASPYRCLVDDVRVVSARGLRGYQVSAVATFHETLVGGTPDAGLPADMSN